MPRTARQITIKVMMMNDGGEGEEKKRRGERRKRGEREGLAESQDVRKQSSAPPRCVSMMAESESESKTLSHTPAVDRDQRRAGHTKRDGLRIRYNV